MREEWVEISFPYAPGVGVASLPVREEWVEIPLSAGGGRRESGLFPRGKSGLKFHKQDLWKFATLSLPAREEWVEIST